MLGHVSGKQGFRDTRERRQQRRRDSKQSAGDRACAHQTRHSGTVKEAIAVNRIAAKNHKLEKRPQMARK